MALCQLCSGGHRSSTATSGCETLVSKFSSKERGFMLLRRTVVSKALLRVQFLPALGGEGVGKSKKLRLC